NNKTSFNNNNNNKYLLNPIRRINSYQPSLTRRFIIRDGKLIEQDNNKLDINRKRRLTFHNLNYQLNQIDTLSIYETPKHDFNQYRNNSFRLINDYDSNLLTTINNQSDMQINQNSNTNQSFFQVSIIYLSIYILELLFFLLIILFNSILSIELFIYNHIK
ncbi:unnamed protein product, partial [Rotaria sp. Silwood2]